jgi:preprotein translocase subunit YajC
MALLIPFLILAAFFVLRANPQRRRVQAQKAMLSTLAPGTRVVTVAGVIGTLVGVEGDRAAIEIAPGVIVEFLVAAIVRPDEPAAPAAGAGDASGHEDVPDAEDPQAPRHEEI